MSPARETQTEPLVMRGNGSESLAEFNLELTSMITHQKNGTGRNSRPDVTAERAEPPNFTIPEDINSWDRQQAAEYYHRNLGWAVHPLYAPDRGQENERGKKPCMKGWRQHTAAEVTPQDLDEHFGPTTNNNLGVVVRPPFISVDLDSKPDAGESVRKWLAEQGHLGTVPRERTGGGAHLHFRCHDLPEGVIKKGNAIVAQITNKVTAELYCDGKNIVLSPSVHKSGERYQWEVTGEIPEVTWAELQPWFGFEEPKKPKRGRPKKLPDWITKYKGDLKTLKLGELFKKQAMLGKCLDPDDGKWSVRCPWAEEHSDGGSDWDPEASDTVIFTKGATPAFKCLHAHCDGRGLEQVCAILEARNPGCIDAHCTEQRVWEQGQTDASGRPRIALPGDGRPDSVFADELGRVLAPKHKYFVKGHDVVSVEEANISEKIRALIFRTADPIEVRTAIEDHVVTGFIRRDENSGEPVFSARTMSREGAAGLVAAPQFRACLPVIVRILPVQIPLRTAKGEIVVPKLGYDSRFRTYTHPDAPKFRRMSLDEACQWFRDLHESFCIKDAQSLTHQIARLITPFCRGIMGWDARFPLWVFIANRPRCGKDYLAGVTQVIYEGYTCEDAPLGQDSEETRKRITAAVVAGRRMMHFANCQGFIQDPTFTGAITSKTFAARALGSTDAKADLILANEIEFSISANEGLTVRPDLEPRTRKIVLAFSEENPNARVFKNPMLHEWVAKHRGELLSAIGAFVRNWRDAGCPAGPTPFNSFPEWASVVGGIMHAGGLGDPCLPHQDDGLEIGGDREERAMRALYALCFAAHPEQWIEKPAVFDLISNSEGDDAFGWFGGFDERAVRGTKTKIGLSLRKYRGRELGGVALEIDASGARTDRQKIRFTRCRPTASFDLNTFAGFRSGDVGDVGDVSRSLRVEKKINCDQEADHKIKSPLVGRPANVSKVAKVATSPVPVVVKSSDTFGEISKVVREAGTVALDIETYGPGKKNGLNPWRGDIRLLTLKVEGREPWLIDLRATGYDLGELGAALAEVLVIGHNLKFDALWLRVKCGVRLPKVFCTLTAARLLSAGTKPSNDLYKCLERYLSIEPAADHGQSAWGAMSLTDDQHAYAARDVVHLHTLKEKLVGEIAAAELEAVAQLEMGLLPVVVEMETAGLAVDRAKLKGLFKDSKEKETAAAAQLRQALSMPGLNPNSPDRLKAALNKAGVKVPNVKAETLKGCGDAKFVPLILAYTAAKSQAQQARSLIQRIAADGRIHGSFNPNGTATGRFSSSDPNLQNVGRGELRGCFIAPPGHKLIDADYSQIELRAAAVIAGEAKMIEAYQRGDDLHKATAAAVLGKPVEAVTKEDRQLGKAVNLGLLYGQSAPGLVKDAASTYGVSMTEAEAQKIRSKFLGTYRGIRAWHQRSWRQVEKGVSEVRTVMGRRRLIANDESKWNCFTALVNTPVQGGTANGMKRALVQLSKVLPASAHIVSTVHDEVIVEAAEHEAEDVCRTVQKVMNEAMAALFPQVPFEVEAHVCTNWGEK